MVITPKWQTTITKHSIKAWVASARCAGRRSDLEKAAHELPSQLLSLFSACRWNTLMTRPTSSVELRVSAICGKQVRLFCKDMQSVSVPATQQHGAHKPPGRFGTITTTIKASSFSRRGVFPVKFSGRLHQSPRASFWALTRMLLPLAPATWISCPKSHSYL